MMSAIEEIVKAANALDEFLSWLTYSPDGFTATMHGPIHQDHIEAIRAKYHEAVDEAVHRGEI